MLLQTCKFKMILGYRRGKAEWVSEEMELELKRGLGVSAKVLENG